MGVFADLPNIQKQTQIGSQNGEQRNIPEMKEQEKSPEKELNEMEASNLLDIEFKQEMVIKMFKEPSDYFKKRDNKHKKDIETTKRTSQK